MPAPVSIAGIPDSTDVGVKVSGLTANCSVARVEEVASAAADSRGLNAAAPCVAAVNAPAVTAPMVPIFKESFKLLPASKELPAPAIKPCPAATAAAPKLPNICVAKGPAIKNNAVPMTILPIVERANFLTALPIFLNIFFNEKNSGSPVTGLVLPLPPRDLNRRISSGVT